MDASGGHHVNRSKPGSDRQGLHVFSHMWEIDKHKGKQKYEKQVSLRGGHQWEKEGGRRKLGR
jgi:hypothetical protein